MERCLFRATDGVSALMCIHKSPFLICTLTWLASNYVSRQGIGTNERNENTKLVIFVPNKINHTSFCFPMTIILPSFQVDIFDKNLHHC